jgi:hypothetical protein
MSAASGRAFGSGRSLLLLLPPLVSFARRGAFVK